MIRQQARTHTSPEADASPGSPTRAVRSKASNGVGPNGKPTRVVANMSSERLEKKRAIDRQAQRAIRQRTKEQIERLEAQVAALEPQNVVKELDEARREREKLERENKLLEQQLAMLRAQADSGALSASPSAHSHPDSAMGSSPATANYLELSPLPRQNPYQAATTPPPDPGNAVHLPGIAHLVNYDDAHKPLPSRSLVHTPTHQPARVLLPHGAPGMPAMPSLSGSPPPWTLSLSPASVPASIRHLNATCTEDHVLAGYIRAQCQRLQRGEDVPEVSAYNLDWFVLLSTSEHQSRDTLALILHSLVRSYASLHGNPELVAVVYYVYLVTMWLITPTADLASRMPNFIQPLECQYATPHPLWIDYLPFARVREYLVNNYTNIHLDVRQFLIDYFEALCVNWHYGTAATMFRDAAGNMSVNPAFAAHLYECQNWTVAQWFLDKYPDMGFTPTASNLASRTSSISSLITQR